MFQKKEKYLHLITLKFIGNIPIKKKRGGGKGEKRVRYLASNHFEMDLI